MKKTLIIIACLTLIICCQDNPTNKIGTKTNDTLCEDKIQILNFGTFHFTKSSDGNTSYIDVNDETVIKEISILNKKLATFKPTVVLVELPPNRNNEIQKMYREHLETDTLNSSFYGEMGLVAFEVGKLSNCKRIYGIDDYEYRNYDWRIGERNQLKLQDPTFAKIADEYEQWKLINTLPLIERLKLYNTQKYRDFMINLNIENLHYVNSPGTFDATDQAMKMYHRNVKWFANINKLKLSQNDRIFLIGGASHTSFLHEMFQRSPKFCLVDVQEILE